MERMLWENSSYSGLSSTFTNEWKGHWMSEFVKDGRFATIYNYLINQVYAKHYI